MHPPPHLWDRPKAQSSRQGGRAAWTGPAPLQGPYPTRHGQHPAGSDSDSPLSGEEGQVPWSRQGMAAGWLRPGRAALQGLLGGCGGLQHHTGHAVVSVARCLSLTTVALWTKAQWVEHGVKNIWVSCSMPVELCVQGGTHIVMEQESGSCSWSLKCVHSKLTNWVCHYTPENSKLFFIIIILGLIIFKVPWRKCLLRCFFRAGLRFFGIENWHTASHTYYYSSLWRIIKVDSSSNTPSKDISADFSIVPPQNKQINNN